MKADNATATIKSPTYDPFDYESIHQNLAAVHGIILGAAWMELESNGECPQTAALFKAADLLGEEVERSREFFDRTLEYCKKGVKHEKK